MIFLQNLWKAPMPKWIKIWGWNFYRGIWRTVQPIEWIGLGSKSVKTPRLKEDTMRISIFPKWLKWGLDAAVWLLCIRRISADCQVASGTALYFIALHCTTLHCIILHCTALHCTALHWTELHCTALHCTALYGTALHCMALHWTALHWTALHCTALKCEDIILFVHTQHLSKNYF